MQHPTTAVTAAAGPPQRAGGRSATRALALTILALAAAHSPADTPPLPLPGTGWELVEIASMDDSVARPESDGPYRLVFGVDGSVAVQADCNRAAGSVEVWDPPRLQFAPLATTLALCGPNSLSERFVRELGWVRSYVYEGDHLYLATMADGSIIEFAPLPAEEASASVDGLSLVADSPDTLRGLALSHLLEAYAAEKGLSANDEEVDAYLARMDRRLRADLGDAYDDGSSLPPEEQAEMVRMRERMARAMIRSWKINRALHEEYGGRIIHQQLGPEPLDAYLELLETARAAGRLRIHDAELEDSFWSYFRDEERHSFMAPGGEDEAHAYATPPWATPPRQEPDTP